MIDEEILSKMRDVHWPEPASWWPLAPGFYIVLAILLITIALACLLTRMLLKRRRLRNEILSMVNSIESEYLAGGDVAALQFLLSGLLRRLWRVKAQSQGSAEVELDGGLALLRDQKKAMEIKELLIRDRFKRNPEVDGCLLLRLIREQVKRCRL